MVWDKPSINRLPGERLQLRHGPISIVLRVWAAPDIQRMAHRLVTRHFPKILPELADELPLLRTPLAKKPKVSGRTAKRMVDACRPFEPEFITPMAAVAGSVAEEVLYILRQAGPIERAYVNDGGDIALHLEPGQALSCGLAGDFSLGAEPRINGTLRLTSDMGIFGVATSGAQGRSFSLGIADSVTVLAARASSADAAATMIANAVDVDSAAIVRKPANTLDPDSDLGATPVTTKIGKLTPAEIATALDAGATKAETYLAKGLIAGAVLMLRGDMRTVGAPLSQIVEKRA